MRIEQPREAERLGGVIMYGVQKVFELDAGLLNEPPHPEETATVRRISQEALHDIEQQMAIIVPVRKERIRLIEGVLCGIPNHCLVIVVSNSPREPVDRFYIERDAIFRLNNYTQKQIMVVHQKDRALARALAEANYPELLDETGLVKNGKAEGMILGTLLARLSGRNYIGFVDSDNYFPGAINEYVKEFCAGFILGESKYSMVRISWHSKPKITESSLFFAKYGRASILTNRVLNKLVSYYTGFGTEVIKTGNAGEHAMTMDLAMLLAYSSGYSIEPYHFVDMWEKFGGMVASPHPEVIKNHVQIFQIESRNPHFHEEKGDEHVESMSFAAMQVIYHSPICPPPLKEEILADMQARGLVKPGTEPPQVIYYPPLSQINLSRLLELLQGRSYAKLFDPASVTTPPPTPQPVKIDPTLVNEEAVNNHTPVIIKPKNDSHGEKIEET